MDWVGWLGLGMGIVLVGLGVYASAKDYKSSRERRRLIRIALSLVVIGGVILGYGIWRKIETELPPRGEGNEGWQEMGQKEGSYSLTVLRDAPAQSRRSKTDIRKLSYRKKKNRTVSSCKIIYFRKIRQCESMVI